MINDVVPNKKITFVFFSIFLAIKREHETELNDSVEYVSTYVQENLNDSIVYMGSVKAENHGIVKVETSPSHSYMDSSSGSSDQMDEPADYSAQLYALYNSRRSSTAHIDGSVIHADDQMNGLIPCSDIQYDKNVFCLFVFCLVVGFVFFQIKNVLLIQIVDPLMSLGTVPM